MKIRCQKVFLIWFNIKFLRLVFLWGFDVNWHDTMFDLAIWMVWVGMSFSDFIPENPNLYVHFIFSKIRELLLASFKMHDKVYSVINMRWCSVEDRIVGNEEHILLPNGIYYIISSDSQRIQYNFWNSIIIQHIVLVDFDGFHAFAKFGGN